MTIVKFNTIFKSATQPPLNTREQSLLEDIIFWAKKCTNQLSPAIKNSGNISFRLSDNFLMTKSGAILNNLSEKDFIPIINCDLNKQEVVVIGNQHPSSETMLHHYIYSKLPDTKVIFHFHDDEVLQAAEKLNLRITQKEAPFGTVELIEEVGKVLESNQTQNNKNYLVIKNHGIISFGKNPAEVAKLVINYHQKAYEINNKNH